MSEYTQGSIGQVLREAREAQGLTLEEAAARLRLMHRQVEAMETDDFDSLGQTVFARGFVRNYARLLGLAPDTLLARMEGAPAEAAAVSRAEPPLPPSWLTSPWLILLMLGVLAAAAAPIALYWWLNSEGEETSTYPARSAAQAPSVPAPVAAPAPAAKPADVPAPAVAVEAVPVSPSEPAAAATEPAEAGAPTAPAAPESPATQGALQLEFGAESWVEISDATGRMLHRQLNPPGSRIEVRGQPPFDLVIGNATEAHMTYNGRPVDLKPYIAVTVARFTLEE